MTAITKLLVANRGEIARRVMRTASAMGIQTVAIYSEGDEHAAFVRDADQAVALRGQTAAESYLDIDKVIAAAKATGADAVHPGYGFLSENSSFAQAVIDAGLIWVGPTPAAIAVMGDKLAAKRLMEKAAVPTLPSVELGSDVDLSDAAAKVGFPALVKAAAGGGGKGMRVVDRASDLAEAVAGAQREALNAFGDGTVFLERYLTGARHIEIQILGDSHGSVVHLFERECSIQRRHQKIIEEAPSSAVSPELRERMGAAGVTAAKAIGYENAGTVEFLLADTGEFFFLEVNTRLQVEHPVTEMITGIDLVREQLLVAQGKPLAFSQADLSINGHAVEARLYAEDPANDFLPVTGTVLVWEPARSPAARYDSGIESGSVIGVEFDPMLAKVITHAPTREEAALQLALALERTTIQGTTTNRDFLVASLRHPMFLAGDTTTSFIELADPARTRARSTVEVEDAAVIAALTGQSWRRALASTQPTIPSGWRNSSLPAQEVSFCRGDLLMRVQYSMQRDGSFVVSIGERSLVARVLSVVNLDVEIEFDGLRRRSVVRTDGRTWWVQSAGGDIEIQELPRFPVAVAEGVVGGLTAPLPGSIISTLVAEGDVVEQGQLLVIVEAMKMEHRIVAPSSGTVTELRAVVGEQVSSGDLLVVIDDGSSA